MCIGTTHSLLKYPLTASAISSAFSTVLFNIYTLSAPLCAQRNAIALAAPPAPSIMQLFPLSSMFSSSSSLLSPSISVLYPLYPPVVLTSVLTAPMARASGSISTSTSITSCLCGTVTLRPSISSAYAPSTAFATLPFSTLKVVYTILVLVISASVLCITGDMEWPTGLPIRPHTLVVPLIFITILPRMILSKINNIMPFYYAYVIFFYKRKELSIQACVSV